MTPETRPHTIRRHYISELMNIAEALQLAAEDLETIGEDIDHEFLQKTIRAPTRRAPERSGLLSMTSSRLSLISTVSCAVLGSMSNPPSEVK
jgi:hypothetical protein